VVEACHGADPFVRCCIPYALALTTVRKRFSGDMHFGDRADGAVDEDGQHVVLVTPCPHRQVAFDVLTAPAQPVVFPSDRQLPAHRVSQCRGRATERPNTPAAHRTNSSPISSRRAALVSGTSSEFGGGPGAGAVVELLGADVSVGEVAVDVKLGGSGKRGIVTMSPMTSGRAAATATSHAQIGTARPEVRAPLAKAGPADGALTWSVHRYPSK
jgi:hypothetical protein